MDVYMRGRQQRKKTINKKRISNRKSRCQVTQIGHYNQFQVLGDFVFGFCYLQISSFWFQSQMLRLGYKFGFQALGRLLSIKFILRTDLSQDLLCLGVKFWILGFLLLTFEIYVRFWVQILGLMIRVGRLGFSLWVLVYVRVQISKFWICISWVISLMLM